MGISVGSTAHSKASVASSIDEHKICNSEGNYNLISMKKVRKMIMSEWCMAWMPGLQS